MRATTPTLLSIAEWRDFIGMNPFYLAQIGVNVPAKSRGDCQATTFQFAYQNSETLCREEIAMAIAQAEELFAQTLGFYPAPKYIINEIVNYPAHFQSSLAPTYYTARGNIKSIQLKWGYLQDTGIEVLTKVEEAAAVVLSDSDGDGIMDTFTVTQTVVAGTLPTEVALFFTTADRNDLPLAEWEIRPLRVSVSGTTATIKGDCVLLVIPDSQLVLNPVELDATDTTIYVDTVSVYRRTTDIAQSGQLVWENYPCEDPPCSVTLTSGCFGARDKRLGYVTVIPAEYDATTGLFALTYNCNTWRAPDRVYVQYKAGYPRASTGKMDSTMARIIALLATSLLPNRTCGCRRADQRLLYYREMEKDQNGTPIIPEGYYPWGLSRGAVEAWRLACPQVQWGAASYGK